MSETVRPYLDLAQELCIDPLRQRQLRLPWACSLNIVYSELDDINVSRVIAECGIDPDSNLRARFIKTACNAHGELVMAMNELIEMYELLADGEATRARAALVKATAYGR